MERKQTLMQFAMTYGAILGGISIIMSLLMYITGYMPFNIKRMILTSLIGLSVMIIFVSFGMKNYRDKVLGGSISFGQAFSVGILIVVFATVLSSFYGLIFNLYIDPEYSNKVLEASKNWTYDFMSRMGAPDASIDEAMDKIEKQQANASPLKDFFSGLYVSAIFGGILSLIVAAFTKKNQNPVA